MGRSPVARPVIAAARTSATTRPQSAGVGRMTTSMSVGLPRRNACPDRWACGTIQRPARSTACGRRSSSVISRSARSPGTTSPISESRPSSRAGVAVAAVTASGRETPASRTVRPTTSSSRAVPPAIAPIVPGSLASRATPPNDVDRHRAQRIAAVGHAGRGHGVGDQRDPVGADEVEDHRDGLVGEVDAVADELHHHRPPGRGRQACRDRSGRAGVQRGHAVEQVRGAEPSSADGA